MPTPAPTSDEELAARVRALMGVTRGADHASRLHAELSESLRAQGLRDAAVDVLQSAARLTPGAPADLEALGFAAFGLGEHGLAKGFYQGVVAGAPDDATSWYNLATALRNVGKLDEAEEACDRCLTLEPHYAQASLLRSHLRTQSDGRNHLRDLEAALRSPAAQLGERIFLHYALGKELDDLGRYDEAFANFAAGARLRRQALRYDVDQDLAKLQRLREAYDADALAAAPQSEPGSYGFIIGLPRSGTTLVERILTGHPNVASNGETDNFMLSLLRHAASTGGDLFDRAARADHEAVAADYARRAGKPPQDGVLLEKLPLNYLYAGAIRLALPSARMILVKRSPADNCFAMFSTLFTGGYPFSYDLTDLARYYAGYNQLTEHWRQSLGPALLEVSYEALTAAPQAEGPRLAEHIGVEWRESMMKVERNPTASATASAAQVRQPIYQKSVGRWRNYERHLEPLLDALSACEVEPAQP